MVSIRAMATFLSTFHDALAAQAEAALIAVVASQPNTTVAELAELVAANPTLGATTLNALVGGEMGTPKRRGRPPGRKAASPATTTPAAPAARKPKGGGARKPNVRTEVGREQFDRDLLAALTEAGGDSVSASILREAVGGDPNQIRAALNRLIEAGEVTFTGKARGTRYSLAGNPTRAAAPVATSDDDGDEAEAEAPKRRGRPPGRKAASPATPAPRKAKAGGKPNVRTEAGREQFDEDLLAALKEAGGDSVSATTLREAVGGDPNQIRTALNRLIERGEVTFTGKARGTRYSLAQAQVRPQIRRAGQFVVGQ
jgi:predicted transcriptional regulator